MLAACASCGGQAHLSEPPEGKPAEEPAVSSGSDNVAPAVVSVVPGAGDVDVPINRKLVVTFSEDIEPESAVNALRVSEGTRLVPGSATVAGNSIQWLARDGLPLNAAVRAEVSGAVEDLAGNPLESAYSWEFQTGGSADSTPPVVVRTDPLRGAGGVPLNRGISVTFSEWIDAESIAGNFQIYRFGSKDHVQGEWIVDRRTVTFVPLAPLPASAPFRATVRTGIVDLAGNALAQDFEWTFTTGRAPDTTAPEVRGIVPSSDATGVDLSSAVVATFSEAIAPASLAGAFAVFREGTEQPIDVALVAEGSTATVRPSSSLEANTRYRAVIYAAVTDRSGNSLLQPYTWHFTTGAAPDTRAPVIASTSPLKGASDVAVDARIVAEFSEAMQPESVEDSEAVILTRGEDDERVDVTLQYEDGQVSVLPPSGGLNAETRYTVTVRARVRDTSGNAMASDYSWSFTTRAAPDTTPPSVTSTVPTDGEADVSVDAAVAASFSEPVERQSVIDNFSLYLDEDGTGETLQRIEGAVSVIDLTAHFTPNAQLRRGATYRVVLGAQVADANGNTLGTDYSWAFSVEEVDDEPLVVTGVSPGEGATGVCTLVAPTITFSEAMNASSVESALRLYQDGDLIPGTPAGEGTVYKLFPDQPLLYQHTYNVTLASEAESTTGKQLQEPLSWSFTTNAFWQSAARASIPEHAAGLQLVLDQGTPVVFFQRDESVHVARGVNTVEVTTIGDSVPRSNLHRIAFDDSSRSLAALWVDARQDEPERLRISTQADGEDWRRSRTAYRAQEGASIAAVELQQNSGFFLAVWVEHFSDTSTSTVWVRPIGATEQLFASDAIRLGSYESMDDGDVSISSLALPDGEFLVAWSGTEASGPTIRTALVSSTSWDISDIRTVASAAAGSFSALSVSQGMGRGLAVWQHSITDGGGRTFAADFALDNSTTWESQELQARGQAVQAVPRLAGPQAVWWAADSDKASIWTAHFDGSDWGTGMKVSEEACSETVAQFHGAPDILRLSDGSTRISWIARLSSPRSYTVMSREVDSSGDLQEATALSQWMAYTPSNLAGPRALQAAGRDLFAVWSAESLIIERRN